MDTTHLDSLLPDTLADIMEGRICAKQQEEESASKCSVTSQAKIKWVRRQMRKT